MLDLKDVFNDPAKYGLTKEDFMLAEISNVKKEKYGYRCMLKLYANQNEEDLIEGITLPEEVVKSEADMDEFTDGKIIQAIFMPPGLKPDGSLEYGMIVLNVCDDDTVLPSKTELKKTPHKPKTP